MPSPQPPTGRTCIVTGASSGIGRATAIALAEKSAHLCLAARNEAALEEVAALCRAAGAEALVQPTDVTSRAEVDRLIQAAFDHWGRIDVLVACAGAYVRAHAMALTVEDLERSLAVNFYGTVYCMLAALPHMLRQRDGHLILVTSMDAKKGLPLDGPYVAAKAAASGLAECMRQDLHGTGVHITTVFPARVDTPLIGSLRVPAVSAKIPPEAVAAAIVKALRNRPPEVILPFQARLLHYVNTCSPRLGDWFVRVLHLEGWEDGVPEGVTRL